MARKKDNKNYYKKKTNTVVKNIQKKPNNIEDNTSEVLSSISSSKKYIYLLVVLLVTFLVHSVAFKNEVTNWDDDKYILKNPHKEISFAEIKKMFVDAPFYMGNYHPLTMLSLAIDLQLSDKKEPTDDLPFGWVDSFWFVLSNLLGHTISTLLLFFIALKIFSFLKFNNRYEIATILSLLFGVHTLHVESVIWLSERKDVLYMMFFMGSLLSYIVYIEKQKISFLLLSIFIFLLSAFSKGQAVSLAMTLIAVDYLYRRKLLSVKVILEKVPFFALAITFGIVAVIAQKKGQAIHSIAEYTHLERLMIASFGLTQYIWKMLIPVKLAAIYPYPYMTHHFPWYYWLSFITPLSLLAGFIYSLKKSKFIAFGIMFFVFNIALLLQIIPVGSAIYADRYSYVSGIGFFFVLICLFEYVNKKSSIKIGIGIFAVYLAFLSFLTFERVQVWQNSISLWDDVIEKSPDAVIAYNNRGSAKKEKKDYYGAINDFTLAIEKKPDYKHAIYNRGTAKKDVSDYQGAIADFNTALMLDPEFNEAYLNRAITRDNMGDLKGAIEDYNQVIFLKPGDVKPYINRGVAYGKSGQFDKSITDFNTALSLDPQSADAYSNRGLAKNFLKQYEQAVNDFNRAIELKPDFQDAYFNRALAYENMKNYEMAVADHTRILQMNPNFPNSYYFRGRILMNLNKSTEACQDFNKALSLGFALAKEAVDKYCK